MSRCSSPDARAVDLEGVWLVVKAEVNFIHCLFKFMKMKVHYFSSFRIERRPITPPEAGASVRADFSLSGRLHR